MVCFKGYVVIFKLCLEQNILQAHLVSDCCKICPLLSAGPPPLLKYGKIYGVHYQKGANKVGKAQFPKK